MKIVTLKGIDRAGRGVWVHVLREHFNGRTYRNTYATLRWLESLS